MTGKGIEMGNFRNIWTESTQFDRSFIESRVREGLPLASLNGGYSTHSGTPANQHGWRFIRVAGRGLGNEGNLVALPLTRENRRIWREGQIRNLVREHGISVAAATMLLDRSRGVSYGHEARVQRAAMALATYCQPDFLRSNPGLGGGLGAWREDVAHVPGVPELSCPRLAGALELAERLQDPAWRWSS